VIKHVLSVTLYPLDYAIQELIDKPLAFKKVRYDNVPVSKNESKQSQQLGGRVRKCTTIYGSYGQEGRERLKTDGVLRIAGWHTWSSHTLHTTHITQQYIYSFLMAREQQSYHRPGSYSLLHEDEEE
jgi:hypothetical protein